MRDIADINYSPIYLLDGKIIKRRDYYRTAVQPNIVFTATDLRCSRWKNEALRVDRVDDIRGRNSFGVHLVRIQVNHYLPHFATCGQQNRSSLDRRQIIAKEVKSDIEELTFGKLFPPECKLKDRYAGSVVTNEIRRINSGRKEAGNGTGDCAHLGHCGGHVRSLVK